MVATAIHFVRKVLAFILPISQKNKSGKQKQKQNKKGCECEKGSSGLGFPSQGQPAPPTLVPSPSRPQDPDLGPL